MRLLRPLIDPATATPAASVHQPTDKSPSEPQPDSESKFELQSRLVLLLLLLLLAKPSFKCARGLGLG